MLRVNETAVGAAVSTATKTLTAMAVSDIGTLPACSRLNLHSFYFPIMKSHNWI